MSLEFCSPLYSINLKRAIDYFDKTQMTRIYRIEAYFKEKSHYKA